MAAPVVLLSVTALVFTPRSGLSPRQGLARVAAFFGLSLPVQRNAQVEIPGVNPAHGGLGVRRKGIDPPEWALVCRILLGGFACSIKDLPHRNICQMKACGWPQSSEIFS